MDTRVRNIPHHLRIEGMNGANPAVYCDISDMKRPSKVTTLQPESRVEEEVVQDTTTMDIVKATQYGALGICHNIGSWDNLAEKFQMYDRTPKCQLDCN